jgi:hypothetical protein
VRFNVYVDGSWLFHQCSRQGILADHTVTPEANFPLDFTKLVATIGEHFTPATEAAKLKPGELHYFTSLVDLSALRGATPVVPEWIERNVAARRSVLERAHAAGFDPTGTFAVPVSESVLARLIAGTYHEKQVDVALAVRLVERAIAKPQRLHVLVTGDLDMLPALQTISPTYTTSLALVTTHPDQFQRDRGQSSFQLNGFDFVAEPLYLEQVVNRIVEGEYVYTCAKCTKVFVRDTAVAALRSPWCTGCARDRASSVRDEATANHPLSRASGIPAGA